MKRFIYAIILVLITATAAQAQTPTVAPNTPIRVAWDYDVPTGTSFSILVDGNIVKNFSSSELTVTAATGTVGEWIYEATMPGLTTGMGRKLKVRAYIGTNPSQNFADSNELVVDVLPTAPRGFRIILTPSTNGDGVQVELRAPDGDATLSSTAVLKFPKIERE